MKRVLSLALCSAVTLTAQSPAPVLGKPGALRVPAVNSAKLSNGITVKLVENHELPLAQLSIVIDGGNRLDGAEPGLTSFTASMLREGAGARDANAIASELAFLGANLTAGSTWDLLTVGLNVPTRTLAPALDILADVVLRPTFTTSTVNRRRDLRLAGILQNIDRPEAVADLAFNHVLYPAGHPYRISPDGDSASTARLDSVKVRTFHTRAFVPSRTTILVGGDLTLAQAIALLEPRFGSWRSNVTPLEVPRVTAPAVARDTIQVYLIDKPGAAQSVISIGATGVEYTSPDRPAINVMNTLLGGSFTSRLNATLREKKGYTYGASSGFTYRRVPGPFLANASVRTDVTDSSLIEFFRELRAIRDARATDPEVERARSYVALRVPQALETNGQIVGQLTSLGVYGLSLADLTAYMSRVQAVTAADVQRVARATIPVTRVAVVVVGDLKKIRPGIEALHLGPITVLDAKDVAR